MACKAISEAKEVNGESLKLPHHTVFKNWFFLIYMPTKWKYRAVVRDFVSGVLSRSRANDAAAVAERISGRMDGQTDKRTIKFPKKAKKKKKTHLFHRQFLLFKLFYCLNDRVIY